MHQEKAESCALCLKLSHPHSVYSILKLMDPYSLSALWEIFGINGLHLSHLNASV